jgi:catechol 2,3-dioxygenase-like lactoylglutathione lyase family enzyme
MKMHLNFATTDLDRSIAFYGVLLDAEPAKVRSDYALFVTDEPGLELALDLRDSVVASEDAHYGIFVETAAGVQKAIRRLSLAGIAGSIEREDTCCYANQTKVWAADPEGRRWEVYTVHEDTEVRDGTDSTCCKEDDEQSRSCCSV